MSIRPTLCQIVRRSRTKANKKQVAIANNTARVIQSATNIMVLAQEDEPKRFIYDPIVTPATGLLEYFLGPMAFNFQTSWASVGIDMDFLPALQTVNKFRPESTYLLTNKEQVQLYAQLHGVPVRASSITDFVRDFPTHDSVIKKASWLPEPNSNLFVCFSLNCPGGYRVVQAGREQSLARTLVTGIPLPPGSRRLAYSFLPVPDRTSLTDYYLDTLGKNPPGPATMHENAFCGIAVAILNDSRPEHRVAGGGNVLVLHPRDDEEREVFAQMKEARRRDPDGIELVTKGNTTFFSDMLEYGLP